MTFYERPGASNPIVPAHYPRTDLCEVCEKRPKFIDRSSGRMHPYCSRSCAKRNVNNRQPASPHLSHSSWEWHARLGGGGHQHQSTKWCNTELQEVKPNGSTFRAVLSKISKAWEERGSVPTLEVVYEVFPPPEAYQRYDQYRTENPSFKEVVSFHSCQCICDLGTKQPVLCHSESCGICRILESSFKSFAFGEVLNQGSHGSGIYSYRNPALANRFATSCTSSPYRVMIMCHVSIQPSNMFDRNVPLVMSTSDHIIPLYVVMYTVKDNYSDEDGLDTDNKGVNGTIHGYFHKATSLLSHHK